LEPKDTDNLGRIDTITIPFFYWAAHNRDNLPEYANVFRYGTYPLDKPNKGKAPDVTGRLEIQITPQDGHGSNDEKVRSALNRITGLLIEREGYHSLLFKTFVPFSTRHLKDTCKSLFPFTGVGREHLASKGFEKSVVGSLVVGVIMLIADIATLAFRLLALIPRAIYQHCLQKNPPLKDVQVSSNDMKVDWGKGTVVVHTYTKDMSGNGTLNISSLNPPAFYLG
jgi:hypothetical protein